MSVAAEVYARLAGDSALTALLSTYRGGPAVLVTDVDGVIEDVVAPFVAVLGAQSDEPNEAKVELGREVLVPVRCYTAATGSVALVQAIAERVRFLLHRKPVGLAQGAYIAECSGPIVAPTDTSFYGREVTLRLVSLPTAIDLTEES